MSETITAPYDDTVLWTEEREPYLMATVPTANGHVGAYELAERFWASGPGHFMDESQPLRFSQAYGYLPAHALEDLGPNLLHKGHAEVTTAHVIDILDRERSLYGELPFPAEKLGTLVFTALIHDSGEPMDPETKAITGRVVGDIQHGIKTPLHRRVEKLVRAANYMRYFPDLGIDTLWAIEDLITHRDESAWHHVLEAGHAMAEHGVTVRARNVADRETAARDKTDNYLRTLGIEIPPGYNAGAPVRTADEVSNLYRLAHRVGTCSLDPIIRELAGDFTYVREYAERQGLLLTA